MPEPLVLKISIDKGNAVIDVQQVATALKQLENQEHETGKGASGMEDDYKKFFREQRTGDRILNESKQAVLGLSSTYVLLQSAMGGTSVKGKIIESTLTTLVMGAQASEFALFSVSRGMLAMGGTAQVVGAKIQASLGWVTLLIGAGMALAQLWSQNKQSAEQSFQAIQQGLQTMGNNLKKELDEFKGDKRLRIEFEISSAQKQLRELRTQLMDLYKNGGTEEEKEKVKKLIAIYVERERVAKGVQQEQNKINQIATSSTETQLELERKKIEAMQESHEKTVALIRQESREEENALQKRISNGQTDALTAEQYTKMKLALQAKREQRLREELELEKLKYQERQNKYEEYLKSIRDLDEQYALALTQTDEQERSLRKKQLQERLQEFEILYGPPTMQQLEQYKRFKLELQQTIITGERTDAKDLYELNANLRKLEINGIQDEHIKALALIDERYDEEFHKAKDNAEKLLLLQKSKDVELANENKKAMLAVAKHYTSSVMPVVSSAWNAIIDSSMSGAEKWKSILDSMKQAFYNFVGNIVQRWIEAQLEMMFLSFLNPVGAITGGVTSVGIRWEEIPMLAMNTPNVGRGAFPQAGLSVTGGNEDVVQAINRLGRKVEQFANMPVVSNVAGETFVRKNLQNAQTARMRRIKIS